MTEAAQHESTSPNEVGRLGIQIVADDDERMAFLPQHFGPSPLYFESQMYAIATKVIAGYRGGLWEFAYTRSGAPFMYLKGVSQCSISTIFGDSFYSLPSEIAGFLVTAQGILRILEQSGCHGLKDGRHDELVDRYHQLIRDGRALAEDRGCAGDYFHLTD